MKKYSTIIFLSTIVLACTVIIATGCQENLIGTIGNVSNNHYVASSTFSFTVLADNQSKLILHGVSGTVHIIGTTRIDSVVIEGEKKVGSESISDAENHLSELSVEVGKVGQEIVVKTVQPQKSFGRAYIVDYIVFVPKNFEISVNVVNAAVLVDSINNDVEVSNINGSIILKDIIGSTTASLTNGSISSKQSLPLNGRIFFSTVNGGISLSIPQNTSADFSGNTVNGAIASSNLIFQNQVITHHSISGRLGNGGATITLKAINGSINLSGV